MVAFIWKIFNLHTTGIIVESPEFHVHSLKESGWQLRLIVPSSWTEKVSIKLQNNYFSANCEDEYCDVGCEVSIMTRISQMSSCCIKNVKFLPSTQVVLDDFPTWFSIARLSKDDYLPKGVLTIQCKLWRLNKDRLSACPKAPPLEPMFYHAITRLGVRKFSTDWLLNFSDLNERKTQTKHFNLGKNQPVLVVETSTQKKNILGFDFQQCSTKFRSMDVTCQISVFDVKDDVNLRKVYSLNLRFGEFSTFPGFFDIDMFSWYKSEYVKNNKVKLVFDFTYGTGDKYSVVESITKFPPQIETDLEPLDTQDVSTEKKNIVVSVDATTSTDMGSHLSMKALQENLLDMYVTNSLSDVILEAEGRTFPCHKCILSARSPVFCTLFSESTTHSSELKASTVGSMLEFLYTGEVSMDFQCALELYEAATKYEVISLKKFCSEYLENNLTEENVCDVLIQASKSEDMELKKKTDSFILSSPKTSDILYSSKWGDIVKNDPKSTVDIMLRALVLEVMENEDLIIFNVERHEPTPYEIEKSTQKHRSDVLSIFQSSLFSDFKLCTKGKTFSVHKNILWARSPVFKAMFSSNIKESSIDIPDVDEQTMERLLSYMYSGTIGVVPELEKLIKLYYSADKYQILSLKDWCSRSFVQVLSLNNVCEALKLIYQHKDLKLKNAVLDFFAKNDESIILSPEWKKFIESNPKLGCYAVCDVYARKMNTSTTNVDPESLINSQDSKANDKLICSESDLAAVLQVDFISLFEEKFLADCTLRVNEKSFEVHKNILCARSPVFNAMFTGNLKEATTSTLNIPDIDESTVDLMLKYLYTGTFSDSENLSVDLQSLYYAADKYQIDTLKGWCSILLAERVCSCNVCEILLLANRHGDKHIETVVREFIVDYHETVFNSAIWQDFMLIEPQVTAKTMYYILTECVFGSW